MLSAARAGGARQGDDRSREGGWSREVDGSRPGALLIVLESDRLRLRWLNTDDAPFIVELLNDPGWLEFIGDKGVRTVEDARNYIEKGPAASYAEFGFGLNLTELKESGTPIGICGLIQRDVLEDVDVGFAILPQYRGQGYAREATAAVIAHGHTAFGLTRIVAITTPDNINSIRVLEKVGLRFERRIRLSADDIELNLYSPDLAPQGDG